MANRFFNQFLFSLVKMLTYVQGSVVIGATGAVGTVTGSGIKSVTRVSAGTYDIFFEDKYPKYINIEPSFVVPVAGTPSGIAIVEVVGSPDTTIASTNPYIRVQCVDYAGTVADPANGCTMKLGFKFRNSSVKGKGE